MRTIAIRDAHSCSAMNSTFNPGIAGEFAAHNSSARFRQTQAKYRLSRSAKYNR